jgi:REP element-mobilizing transposase RayT
LLHRIGFVYKKTKQIAMKVDEVAQVEFIEKFNLLQAEKKPDEVHYFIDAVHPTLNSETSYGWIEKGSTHQIYAQFPKLFHYFQTIRHGFGRHINFHFPTSRCLPNLVICR